MRSLATLRPLCFPPRVASMLYLLSVGLVSILAQVVILRELSVAFFGVELIYIVAMAVWLSSTALGAVIGRRSRAGSGPAVGVLLAVFALLLPADVAFIRALRTVFGGVPGTYLPFGLQVLGLLVALLPVGIVLGLLFQWTARDYIGEKHTLARAYAIESAGGVLGGLVSTFLLMLGVQNFSISVFCGFAAAATAIAPRGGAGRFPATMRTTSSSAATAGSQGPARDSSRNRARHAGIVAVSMIVLLALVSPPVDRALTRIDHPTLVASRDSPYSRITVTQQGEQFIFYENDALAFETQNVTAEEFVHLAATNVDTLRRVLILGGGIEGLITEVLQYPLLHVDYVELNPVVVSLAETHLPPSQREPLRSKSVTLAIADPRRFVQGVPLLYDLILVGMPDPTSAQSNRFYTGEFFEQCARIVARGGVLALRLPSAENIWTPFLAYRNTSIIRALGGAFRDVVVMPGATNIVVASNEPLSRDPVFLGNRLKSRNVTTRLVTPEYISYLYTNDRFFEIAEALSTTAIPPNTDVRPVCYKYSSMIWLSKFFPKLITADAGSSGTSFRGAIAGAAALLALLCGVLALSRRRLRSRRIVLAMLAGFIGMVLETELILYYQVKSGVLYQNLGILLMVFMTGLVAGAAAVPYFTRSGGKKSLPRERLWGTGFFLGFSLLNLALIGLARLDTAGLPVVSLFLFLGGVLVSGVFAYASVLGAGDQRALVSPLYAADLVGGCAGSLLGSIVLVPFFGMEQTAWVMTVLSLAALLVV